MRLLLVAAAGLATAANPIRRVVTLLEKMKTEIEAEGEKEADLYQKFQCFCSGNEEKMSGEAEAAKQKVTELEAQIEQDKGEKARLDGEIVDHKRTRAECQSTIKSANTMRDKEHAAYMAEAGDVQGNVDAIDAAVTALERGTAGAFLQGQGETGATSSAQVARLRKMALVGSRGIDHYQQQSLTEFLSGSTSKDYQPSSGQIVGILKQMKDQFNADLSGIVSEEEAAAKAFNSLVAAKKKEITSASAAVESKTERSGTLAVAVTQAKADVKETKASLGETERLIVELSMSCENKASERDGRIKQRQDELVAISDVIAMLGNDDALEAFRKGVRNAGRPEGFGETLLQRSAASATAGTRRALRLVQSAAQQAAQSEAAGAANSILASLLHKAGSGKVGFHKVQKMIADMIAHLDAEQSDDDAHRDYCVRAKHEAQTNRTAIEGSIEKLSLSVDESSNAVSRLGEEVEAATAEISNLDKAVADATEQRKAENKAFVELGQELGDALHLLGLAKQRLLKFYNPKLARPEPVQVVSEEERIAQAVESDASASNFVQVSRHGAPLPDAPETWAEANVKHKRSSNAGVMSLMDMLVKQVEADLHGAQKDEEVAQREYELLMKNSKNARHMYSREVTQRTAARADLEARLEEDSESKGASQEELETVKSHLHELSSSCDWLEQNFDVRKAARATERESLQNASAALKGAQ